MSEFNASIYTDLARCFIKAGSNSNEPNYYETGNQIALRQFLTAALNTQH